jgi:hypothetical protein
MLQRQERLVYQIRKLFST